MFSLLKFKEAEEFIKNNPNNVIYLLFTTNWCGDCHMMMPICESVSYEYSNHDNISFIQVDAEEAGIFRKDSPYKVERVPTHVFIKNSEIRSIMYEYITKDIIINEIDQLRYEK